MASRNSRSRSMPTPRNLSNQRHATPNRGPPKEPRPLSPRRRSWYHEPAVGEMVWLRLRKIGDSGKSTNPHLSIHGGPLMHVFRAVWGLIVAVAALAAPLAAQEKEKEKGPETGFLPEVKVQGPTRLAWDFVAVTLGAGAEK